MTPRNLFAVLVAVLGVWYVCMGAQLVFALVVGPFSPLVVGAMLLMLAVIVYHGGRP